MTTQRMSKSELQAALAQKSGLTRKQVAAVLDGLSEVMRQQLGKKGPGEFVLPGLLKLNVIVKPAVPARKGINPFTKEPTVFKAKPKRKVIKARVLKSLKEAV